MSRAMWFASVRELARLFLRNSKRVARVNAKTVRTGRITKERRWLRQWSHQTGGGSRGMNVADVSLTAC